MRGGEEIPRLLSTLVKKKKNFFKDGTDLLTVYARWDCVSSLGGTIQDLPLCHFP